MTSTTKAAKALGVSVTTLRRWVAAGWVQEGVHFKRGRFAVNSPWEWDVASVAAAIEKLPSLPPLPSNQGGTPSTHTTPQ